MTDETNIEVEVDEVEAEPTDVSADADIPAVPDSILGATDAETPEPEPVEEVSAETPQEKYARLLAEGVKPSRITVITNTRGQIIEAQVQ